MRISVLLTLFIVAGTLRGAGPAISLSFESATEHFTAGDAVSCPAAALVDLGDRIFLAWPAAQEGEHGIVVTTITTQLAEIPGSRVFIKDEERASCVAAASSGPDIALVWLTPMRRAKVGFLDRSLRAVAPPAVLFSPFVDARPFLAEAARPDTINQNPDTILLDGLVIDPLDLYHSRTSVETLNVGRSTLFLPVVLSVIFSDVANDLLFITHQNHVPSRIDQCGSFAPT